MRLPKASLAIPLLAVLFLPLTAGAGESLENWLGGQVATGITDALRTHPRFAGQRVAVAPATGSAAEQAPANALAVRLADELQQALRVRPGVDIAWASGEPACVQENAADYRIVVDVRPRAQGGGEYRVDVGIVDVHEQRWLSDFAQRWEGTLSASQRRLAGRPAPAPDVRGSRQAPFGLDESDLLAERLARTLDCQLRVFSDAGITVAGDEKPRGAPVAADTVAYEQLRDTPELVAHLLARRKGIAVLGAGTDAHRANTLQLGTRIRRINESLLSVWVVARSTDQDGVEYDAATAQAYVLAPQRDSRPRELLASAPAAPAPVPAVQAPAPRSLLPESPRLIKPAPGGDCRGDPWGRGVRWVEDRTDVGPGECFGLEIDVAAGAWLFLVHEPMTCERVTARTIVAPDRPSPSRTPARTVVRTRGLDTLRLPLQPEDAFAWRARGGLESFYFVAARDADAARRLQRQLHAVPPGCDAQSDAWRGEWLAWLSELDATMARLGERADWQGFRVRHVE